MADFPDDIFEQRTLANVAGQTYNPDKTTRIYAEDLNNLGSEITAIEETVGTEPAGAFDTMRQRMENLEIAVFGAILPPGLDQFQFNGGTNIGWGEYTGMRYRGQSFTPTKNYLTGVAFDRDMPSKDLKIYVDITDGDDHPVHDVSGALYSFTVANADITGGLQLFELPVPFATTPGTQYIFYVAPWSISDNAYEDDYHDARWNTGGGYSGGSAMYCENSDSHSDFHHEGSDTDMLFYTTATN